MSGATNLNGFVLAEARRRREQLERTGRIPQATIEHECLHAGECPGRPNCPWRRFFHRASGLDTVATLYLAPAPVGTVAQWGTTVSLRTSPSAEGRAVTGQGYGKALYLAVADYYDQARIQDSGTTPEVTALRSFLHAVDPYRWEGKGCELCSARAKARERRKGQDRWDPVWASAKPWQFLDHLVVSVPAPRRRS